MSVRLPETFNTFRAAYIGFGLNDCGEKTGYQVQNMDSLNTKITLLNGTPDPDVAPDAELADLAQKVNQFFAPKAWNALVAKRAQLVAAGRQDLADRCEITVLLTDRGLQLGWSSAREWKEIAPAPKKPLLRRVLGPLYPGRRYWRMPENNGVAPQTKTVQWPWIFWAVVALVLAYLGWSLGAESFTPWAADAVKPAA